jgi:hypothetical protein
VPNGLRGFASSAFAHFAVVPEFSRRQIRILQSGAVLAASWRSCAKERVRQIFGFCSVAKIHPEIPMLREKMTVEQYESKYGPLPPRFQIAGAQIIRREFPLTDDSEVFLELPPGLPAPLEPPSEAIQ